MTRRSACYCYGFCNSQTEDPTPFKTVLNKDIRIAFLDPLKVSLKCLYCISREWRHQSEALLGYRPQRLASVDNILLDLHTLIIHILLSRIP